MSANGRYRERKHNTSDNDRLLRALSQPVQAWDKKWTQNSNSKILQTHKWVKSDRTIEFEEDEESEEESEPMETDQTPLNEGTDATPATITTTTQITETTEIQAEPIESSQLGDYTTAVAAANNTTTIVTTTTATTSVPNNTADDIPGGPSSLITNRAISPLVEEVNDDDDDRRSQTPKLDDISDEEPEPTLDDDNDDNDVDSINDASRHPAFAPHAQAHLTDDESMTDSAAVTPQTTTEGNTPMPLLEEDNDEGEHNVPHPLSQEILMNTTGIMNEDMGSLNNDSPAIQTPEDTNSSIHLHHQPQEQQQQQPEQ